ncbi:MAG: GntR family transcriptional regulator [Treponema sp.]|jgi:GntR family transcriptional regulator of arabinose operon|nr:GntR family transcriptional regulator [Treponema sp.]
MIHGNILQNIRLDDGGMPKYRQLQIEIARLIREDILLPQTQLPSEHEFRTELGVSRTTIRQAFQLLEEKNLIHRVQGRGTFIGAVPTEKNMRPRKKDMHMIGVLVPNITNQIYPGIIRGIEANAYEKDAVVFAASSGGSRDREYQLITELINRSIDGLILEPLHSGLENDSSRTAGLLNGLNIPVIIINNDIPQFTCSKIMLDDTGGARSAVQHIIAFGHKRIAYIYKNTVKAALDRRLGYMQALKDAGIPHDESIEFSFGEEEERIDTGYRLTKTILEHPEWGITAVFYYNDDLALQGMDAALDMNVQVPADLSIVGYDDIPRSAPRKLSTVSHPQILVGRWALDLLFEYFDHHVHHYRLITISSEIIRRNTVAAPSR